jgi:hypothetical protein
VRFDISDGAVIEGHRLGSLKLLLVALRPSGFDRVNPVEPHFAALGRVYVSRQGKWR